LELIQIKQAQLKSVKSELLEKQAHTCPITKLNLKNHKDIDAVVDHKHKQYKDQVLGHDGIGLIRGVLHRYANSFEGKVQGAFNRSGMVALGLSLPNVLRELANYLEQDPTNYIHPNEEPKEPKLTKVSYNSLVKILKASGFSKKIPEYPKSGKLTKDLSELYKKMNITPEFYKS
jgi:hypothetical protein